MWRRYTFSLSWHRCLQFSFLLHLPETFDVLRHKIIFVSKFWRKSFKAISHIANKLISRDLEIEFLKYIQSMIWFILIQMPSFSDLITFSNCWSTATRHACSARDACQLKILSKVWSEGMFCWYSLRTVCISQYIIMSMIVIFLPVMYFESASF